MKGKQLRKALALIGGFVGSAAMATGPAYATWSFSYDGKQQHAGRHFGRGKFDRANTDAKRRLAFSNDKNIKPEFIKRDDKLFWPSQRF
jgi:hypothetical protein